MEPVSIVSIVNGSLGLGFKISSLVKYLYDISQRLKQAELTILSLVVECETIQAAWVGIENWAREQPIPGSADYELLGRLSRSLKSGNMVISAFEADIKVWSRGPASTSFLRRSRIVWEEATFKEHQFRIRGQVAVMTLLLQVINLPTRKHQTDLLLRQGRETFRSSDESAWTIIDSRASFSSRLRGSQISFESTNLVHRPLDCENELFVAPAYKRDYTVIKLLHSARNQMLKKTEGCSKEAPRESLSTSATKTVPSRSTCAPLQAPSASELLQIAIKLKDGYDRVLFNQYHYWELSLLAEQVDRLQRTSISRGENMEMNVIKEPVMECCHVIEGILEERTTILDKESFRRFLTRLGYIYALVPETNVVDSVLEYIQQNVFDILFVGYMPSDLFALRVQDLANLYRLKRFQSLSLEL